MTAIYWICFFLCIYLRFTFQAFQNPGPLKAVTSLLQGIHYLLCSSTSNPSGSYLDISRSSSSPLALISVSLEFWIFTCLDSCTCSPFSKLLCSTLNTDFPDSFNNQSVDNTRHFYSADYIEVSKLYSGVKIVLTISQKLKFNNSHHGPTVTSISHPPTISYWLFLLRPAAFTCGHFLPLPPLPFLCNFLC